MTARRQIDEQLLEEAEAWHATLAFDDADWDGYTLWLEADLRHRDAFDAVTLTHRIVEERAGNLDRPVPVEQPRAVSVLPRRQWLYGAIAATIALAIGFASFWLRPTDTIYATSQGETRQIALGSGIGVDLAPSSRLVVAGGKPTALELAQGEAVFTVAHDPDRRLSIKAGEYAVSDIGTTFGVNLSNQAVKVAVAEGRLTVTPDRREATQVSAGQQFIAGRAGGSFRLSPVPAEDVGSWRQGRLVYNETPLAVVTADITRYSGKTVVLDPAIEGQSFSGVLAIGDGSKLLADLANIAGFSYRQAGDHARLGPGSAR